MRDDFRKDLDRSSTDFERIVWPEIQPVCGGGTIVCVERTYGSNPLDTCAGIDYLHVTPSNEVRPLATRVQYGPSAYSSFTVREARTSGARTELAKRQEAISSDRGYMYPYLTIQAYVDKSRQVFLGAGIVKTRDLYEYIGRGKRGADYEFRTNGCDGNSFIVVWWRDLQAEGIRVSTLGDENLLSRQLSVYSTPQLGALV